MYFTYNMEFLIKSRQIFILDIRNIDIVWCIDNKNINIQLNVHEFTVIRF